MPQSGRSRPRSRAAHRQKRLSRSWGRSSRTTSSWTAATRSTSRTRPSKLLELLGWEEATRVLTTLASGPVRLARADEQGQWHHPDDLVALIADAPATRGDDATQKAGSQTPISRSWPGRCSTTVPRGRRIANRRASARRTYEQLARSVTLASALRVTRFHVQNDHGDWDVVHHAFTPRRAAPAHHGAPTPELAGHLPRRDARLSRSLLEHPSGTSARVPRTVTPLWISRSCGAAGTKRGWSMRPERSSTSGCDQVAAVRRCSQRSAPPCSQRTPSSTGSRPTRRVLASRCCGRRAPKRLR